MEAAGLTRKRPPEPEVARLSVYRPRWWIYVLVTQLNLSVKAKCNRANEAIKQSTRLTSLIQKSILISLRWHVLCTIYLCETTQPQRGWLEEGEERLQRLQAFIHLSGKAFHPPTFHGNRCHCHRSVPAGVSIKSADGSIEAKSFIADVFLSS